ncbi:MAG TPA: hypothetical protein P5268_02045 [Candidatus Marinimicrobia bacterium]|nr:hypothetical protein [Candidatus Neomarinimicrobiota bacterium]HRS50861.1 hypothetical protein [Candidatus Neomarinimicrobiota bacterium]HRU91797.1 hypothetical protein [Candidatus Neomarinimicrobiota bacterium]
MSPNKIHNAIVINKAVCPKIPENKLSFKIVPLDDDAGVKAWRDAVRAAIKNGAERFLLIGRGLPTQKTEKLGGIAITDQINVSGQNPLVGPNDEEFGTRFPDMTNLYNAQLVRDVLNAGKQVGLALQKGILLVPASMTKLTTLEEKIITQNEIAAHSQDVFAGAITAKHAGRQCAGLILFTDIAGDKLLKLLAYLKW